jgi:hypothetical protein
MKNVYTILHFHKIIANTQNSEVTFVFSGSSSSLTYLGCLPYALSSHFVCICVRHMIINEVRPLLIRREILSWRHSLSYSILERNSHSLMRSISISFCTSMILLFVFVFPIGRLAFRILHLFSQLSSINLSLCASVCLYRWKNSFRILSHY